MRWESMQKKTVIQKQLGIIQSMKLRLLFTIFSSKLRLLFGGGFYSRTEWTWQNSWDRPKSNFFEFSNTTADTYILNMLEQQTFFWPVWRN